ncbi:ATP-binding protein [Effusibacillus lacus]|nr:ATP-binding protein [Effusibacillus lacus]
MAGSYVEQIKSLIDPDKLARVIENLVTNAIKYSYKLGEVAVTVSKEEDHVRIGVRSSPVNGREQGGSGMTVRFNMDDVAEMLKVPIDQVRMALEELREQGKLTAETFPFAEKAWRIAPIDIKRIQKLLGEKGVDTSGAPVEADKPDETPKRRIVKKVVKKPGNGDEGDSSCL